MKRLLLKMRPKVPAGAQGPRVELSLVRCKSLDVLEQVGIFSLV